jgi:hypothetical protein
MRFYAAALPPPPTSSGVSLVVVAIVGHFGLSLVQAGLTALRVERQLAGGAAVLGAAFGLILSRLSLHGVTRVFPWSNQAQDRMAVVAHVAFGVLAAGDCRRGPGWRLA